MKLFVNHWWRGLGLPLKVLEIDLLRFGNGDIKVTFTRQSSYWKDHIADMTSILPLLDVLILQCIHADREESK